jgi:hypothetical protein
VLRLLGALTLIGIFVTGLGYYRGWFAVSTTKLGDNTHIDVKVDKAKIMQDKDTAQQKLVNLREKAGQTVNSNQR